jgi:hypothetical protein
MVFEPLLLAVAFGGSVIASAYDLKTTEVPDWVFYAMIGIGFPLVAARAVLSGDFMSLLNSLMAGGGLMGFGYLMYRVGQWGGADAVLLGILGFLFPAAPTFSSATLLFPFPVSLLFNIFIIGLIYMLAYSFVFALMNPHVVRRFVNSMRSSARLMALLSAALFVSVVSISAYFSDLFTARGIILNSFVSVGGALSFVVVYRFAQSVENFGFRKRIPVSKLKIGDMLLDSKVLVGVDRKTINRIRGSGQRWVWIKEGVRFIPAFPLALLFTMLYGDAISYLISIL